MISWYLQSNFIDSRNTRDVNTPHINDINCTTTYNTDYEAFKDVPGIIYCGLTDDECLRLAARHNINGHFIHAVTHCDYVSLSLRHGHKTINFCHGLCLPIYCSLMPAEQGYSPWLTKIQRRMLHHPPPQSGKNDARTTSFQQYAYKIIKLSYVIIMLTS